jgi:hypothetical protein
MNDGTQPAALPRLLPLVERSANDGVANALGRLLVEDPAQAEDGARLAILILTGIQTFLDSDGSYAAVEQIWEPVIVARHMAKAYGTDAWKKAAEMSGVAKTVADNRGAQIYASAAVLLAPEDIKKRVDWNV